MSDVPIRYAVSIGQHEDEYWAIIYLPDEDKFTRIINPNLTKLMNLVSKRVRSVETKRKKFPLPTEPQSNLIILPNGT